MDNRKKSIQQAVKFTLFSVSAGVIQVGSFALLGYLFAALDRLLAKLQKQK